jgi:serine/threonine protein phosphatase 1
VLSVGDLINRGPDSLGTLSLIEEPWFHAVMGNHELMLLNFLGYYNSRVHSVKAFRPVGGAWISEAILRQRKTVRRLADRIAALPLAIHVEADCPFNVMHGDLAPFGDSSLFPITGDTVGVHEADQSTSSRLNFHDALRSSLFGLRFAHHPVQISETPVGDLPITYVGHSPIRLVTVHNSYVYIDQGICQRSAIQQGTARQLTILDHSQFSRWLQGVATARGGKSAVRALEGGGRRKASLCR